MKNKRVTIFIGSLSGGGAERVACNLANYLSRRQYYIDVVTMSDTKASYGLNENVKEIALLSDKEKTNKIKDNLVRNERLKKYIKENQDVSCYIVMLPITIFMLARLRRMIPGKTIIAERCNPDSYSLLVKMMMRYAAKRCDLLVVQTKEIGNWYKDVKNKIIIPNAINKDVVMPERREVLKKIVAVGRLTKQKNYPMLIKGFYEFQKKHPEYILEIYGQGQEKEELERLVREYGISKKVKFLGYVSNVSERIADAKCFVMTSNYEGMPNALIEAMCMGLPCIATDCDGGGAKALILNDKNGVLIPKNDVDELVGKMNRIVEDDDFAKKIAENAKELKNQLSYDKIYAEWEKAIANNEGIKNG